MKENTTVVERADALMRRRRSFVASPRPRPSPPDELPTATIFNVLQKRTEDDDLPLLTEVIPSAPTAPTAPADDDLPLLTDEVPPEALHEDDTLRQQRIAAELSACLAERLAAELSAELVRAIEQRLAAELPTLIEAILLNTGQELRAGIEASVGEVCRDFVRRHPRTD